MVEADDDTRLTLVPQSMSQKVLLMKVFLVLCQCEFDELVALTSFPRKRESRAGGSGGIARTLTGNSL
jgi:hypothetical protein